MIKFAVIGVINTLVDWGVFALLSLIPFFKETAWLTEAISYSCGLLSSFFLNRRFTFKSQVKLFSMRGLRFVIANLLVYGLTTLGIYLVASWLDVSNTLAKLIVTPLTGILNFVLSRLFVFNDKTEENADAEKDQ